MRTEIPEQVYKIIDQIDNEGHAKLQSLDILSKWCERPKRLRALALRVAKSAIGRSGKTTGYFAVLLSEGRRLLGCASTHASLFFQPDRKAAEDLFSLAQAAQDKTVKRNGVLIRDIRCRPLFLMEKGLETFLWRSDQPDAGYKLAAEWAGNRKSKIGINLSGTSRGKLEDLVRFLIDVEAVEDD